MFITADPFPLGYGDCRGLDDLCAHIQAVLQDYRLRRSTKIAIEGAKNFAILESDRWSRLDATLARLPTDDEPDAERTAADFLAETFHGIGPKQSRNLLQDLGLTRFEIPIDSRIARWLNAFGFPVRINAATLADPNYYAFVSRGVQELCRAAGVLPCVLDAAVFASYDGEKWNDPAVKI
jgi:thermostable 8-oxoguanine DNA glycosylase